MTKRIECLDVVTLIVDLPERNLWRGQVGTIVACLAPGVFEVEFSDNTGVAYAMLTLKESQLMPLIFAPVASLLQMA